MFDQLDERLFLGYVEGDLSLDDRRVFEKQMSEDPRLEQLVTQVIQDRQLLRESPRAEVPEQVLDVVEQRLEREMLLGDSLFDDGLRTYSLKSGSYGGGRSSRRRTGSLARVAAYGAMAAMLILVGGISFYLITETHHLGRVVHMSAEHEATFQDVLRRSVEGVAEVKTKEESLAELASIAENAWPLSSSLSSSLESVVQEKIEAHRDVVNNDAVNNNSAFGVNQSSVFVLAGSSSRRVPMLAAGSAMRYSSGREIELADAIETLRQAASQSVDEVVSRVAVMAMGADGGHVRLRPEVVIDVVASRPDVSERVLIRRARDRHWGIKGRDDRNDRAFSEPLVRPLTDVLVVRHAGFPRDDVRDVWGVRGVRVMLSVPRDSVSMLVEELRSVATQWVRIVSDVPNSDEVGYGYSVSAGFPSDGEFNLAPAYAMMRIDADFPEALLMTNGPRVLVAVDIRPMHFDQSGWLGGLR